MGTCNVCRIVMPNTAETACPHCGTEYPVITIRDFVERFCQGGKFDSCYSDSNCRFASNDGCTHEQHPKNNR